VPKTLDELEALAKKMQADKLVPIAFADKDGWPAMGTFDALNMRINGYQYHIDLMAGQKAWDSPETRRSSIRGGCCCPTTRERRSAGPGRRPRRPCSRRRRACTCFGTFMNEQFPEKERTTWTSSRS
jgi:multiple sugar transport system substrate-binding protein